MASQAFIDEANNPYGEALAARVRIRADLAAGGSNQLVTLTDVENLQNVTAITRKREREYGIIEGAQWSVTFTHDGLSFNPNSASWLPADPSMLFKAAQLQVGFPTIDEWETVAAGRIEKTRVGTDGLARLTVRDPIMDLLASKLDRDRAWTTTGWTSFVKPYSVGSGSKQFDNTNNPPSIVAGNEAFLGDFTYLLQFTSATTFDIIHVDDGAADQTGLSIASNQNIVRGLATVLIPTAGWDQTSGAYQSGDTFVVYTGPKYGTSTLNPITVLKTLISDTLGLLMNVSTGLSTMTPYADGAVSSWSTVESRFTTQRIEGVFESGTEIVKLIEGILIGVNCTIFPLKTGQIGIYHFYPDDIGSGTAVVTGDTEDPDASILSAERSEDMQNQASRVLFRYVPLSAVPSAGPVDPDVTATYEAVEDPTPFEGLDLPYELESPWAWTPTQIENVTNQALLRRKDFTRVYKVTGTLRELATLDLSELLLVTEPELSETLAKLQVAQLALDVFGNTVEVLGWQDPVVLSNFARINRTYVDSTTETIF